MSSRTILIIDDEINLRRSLALILQEAGYLVSTAANAAEGLQMVITSAYDLIFLDLQLPDRSGVELLPEIRKLHPDTPVLILTAHATLSSAMEAVRHGARDYMIKPIKPELLLRRIDDILEELSQPKRRRELVNQIQGLLSELRDVDHQEQTGESTLIPAQLTDPSRIIRCGPFSLVLHTKTVLFREQAIKLPPSTFDYLVTLIRHAPNPVTYETLVVESQGYTITRAEAREMARWQIHELRKSIEPNPDEPQYIMTVRNVGYRIIT
jgi:DNA-binding response OmpR family regulator